MFDIIAIGSATRDNFLRVNYDLIDWPKTPLKKAIILPFGEKLGIEDVYFTIGGNAVNASVTFGRQGFKTACFAKLGDDLPAQELKKQLNKENVNTKLMIHSREKPTAYSVILLKDGERTILGYHGASHTLTIKDVNFEKLKSRWWYLSLAGESAVLYPELIKFAKENNIKVAFNPSTYHIFHYRDPIINSLKDLAFLVVNAGEASKLTGISFNEEERVFKKLDELTPGIVAVTNGVRGVMVSDGKYLYKAGIFPEKQLVDRTGAGDSFGAGFVVGLINKLKIKKGKLRVRDLDVEDIKYAIRLASANAASVIEHIGATEGILIKKDFEENSRWRNLNMEIKKIKN